jgi:hypothetical protein
MQGALTDTTFFLYNCRSKGARNGCSGLATAPTTLHPAKLPNTFQFFHLLIIEVNCLVNTISIQPLQEIPQISPRCSYIIIKRSSIIPTPQ